MAEKIKKGFVINRINFNIFDEIVIFLLETNEKIACLSLGSRKIQSKNSRNLFLGNFVEIEFFESRSPEKISKLKKVTTIEYNDWKNSGQSPYLALNELATKVVNSKKLFHFYKEMIEFYKKNIDEEAKILLFLKKTCSLIGLNIHINGCVVCGSKMLRTFSLKEHGFLCYECLKEKKTRQIDTETSKLIFNLFHVEDVEKYDFYTKKNAIKMLVKFIDENGGILIKTLESY